MRGLALIMNLVLATGTIIWLINERTINSDEALLGAFLISLAYINFSAIR